MIDLGVGVGAEEMNRKRKNNKNNPDDRTAHNDLLVPEARARSKVTDHAVRRGRGGRQVGRGGREGQRQRRCEGTSRVTAEKQEGPLVLPAAGPQVCLLQVFFLESVVGCIFPLPTLQLARHGS